MDTLVSEWALATGSSTKLRYNEGLIRFLGDWLFSDYQPFPEKADFWDRLFVWLDQIGNCDTRTADQQAMFNLIPHLLFAAERDLTSMYRAAFEGPILRWLIGQGNLDFEKANLDSELNKLRQRTWFGSLAGMDISGFCRVNRIIPQSYRPEFRFVAEFCDVAKVRVWLKDNNYDRIVVVEDMIGTGTQFIESLAALRALDSLDILFVPLFITPDEFQLVRDSLEDPENRHISCEPICVLPEACLIRKDARQDEHDDIAGFRDVICQHGHGQFGFGEDYGTLVLSFLNCPDNVPPILYEPTDVALFPRASREG
jgi:hypothetical protein